MIGAITSIDLGGKMKRFLLSCSLIIFVAACSDGVLPGTEDEEANIALVRHQLRQMDAGNLDIFDEICAPAYRYYAPGGGEPLTCTEHKDSA